MKDKIEFTGKEIVEMTNVFRTYECRMHEIANLCFKIDTECSLRMFRESLLNFLLLCNTLDYDIDRKLLEYLDENSLAIYKEDRKKLGL